MPVPVNEFARHHMEISRSDLHSCAHFLSGGLLMAEQTANRKRAMAGELHDGFRWRAANHNRSTVAWNFECHRAIR
jgi:hypothetical protein